MDITFTGADQRTPLSALASLALQGAEIGILYTFDPDGRNRYPERVWIEEAASKLTGRLALHVCGSRARFQLLARELDALVAPFQRIQVNGHLLTTEVGRICDRFPEKKIITQYNGSNLHLLDCERPNHALLVDASGGRGLLPSKWSRPETDKPVGFAGGLGPHNLAEELPKIAALSNRSDGWIDMEGRLRDKSDWFSVERAQIALDVYSLFLRDRYQGGGRQ
jgi:hypothetical protein